MTTLASRPSLPLQPTTPRTPQRVYPNNNNTNMTGTTPRSSRRQTFTNGPNSTPGPSRFYSAPSFEPLPPLPLRPFPSELYARSTSLEDMLERDQNRIDRSISLLKEFISGHQRGLNEHLAETEMAMKKMESDMRELEGLAVGWSEDRDREREEAEGMKEREKVVEQRERTLKGQISTLKESLVEERAKLATLRQFKDAQRSAFNHQTSQNAPELSFFESKLGLKIRSLARDRILFKFANIDPGSYTRIFSFEVDVSSPTYIVSQPTPLNFLPKETLDGLVDRLNTNRDLYGFFIDVRKALKDEVGRERERGR